MNEIFDRKLLKQNQKRYLSKFSEHNFLYHEIADRIVENLQFFLKTFEDCLEIEARDSYLSGLMLQEKNIKNVKTICDDDLSSLKKESFDLIVSNLNLHHINFIPQFLMEAKSLLKPEGIFVASFFGEENLPQLHKTISEVESEIYQGISPRMIPTIDVKTAAMLLQKAGFANPVSTLERVDVEYENPLKLLKDLKMMGQGNIMFKRSRKFFSKGFLQKVLQEYKNNYQTSDGAVKATFEIITIIGTK